MNRLLSLLMLSAFLVACSSSSKTTQSTPKGSTVKKLASASQWEEIPEMPVNSMQWLSSKMQATIAEEDGRVKCYLLDVKKDKSARGFAGQYVIDSTKSSPYGAKIKALLLDKNKYLKSDVHKTCGFSPMVAFCFGEDAEQQVLLDFSCSVAEFRDVNTGEKTILNFDPSQKDFQTLSKKVFNAAAFDKRLVAPPTAIKKYHFAAD